LSDPLSGTWISMVQTPINILHALPDLTESFRK
jgi:hypothetical protein